MANLKTRPKFKPLQIVFSVVLVGSLVFGGYYFKQYRDLKATSSKTPEEKNKELVVKINKVYALPKDEDPVVAIVSDEGTFKKEYPVFTTAQKGDNLLLYEKAGQAILFRESENKVIGTASFTVNSGAAVHIIAPGDVQNTTEQTLVAKLGKDIRVSSKSTPLGQYTAITVVDTTGQKAELTKKIADALGGTVATTLPAGEKAADGAEIVVVMGTAPATPTDTPVTP
jgi:hypothetical protein